MRPAIVGHRANSVARISFYLMNGVDMVEVDVTGDRAAHGPEGIKPATLTEALLRRLLFSEPRERSLDVIISQVRDSNVGLVVDLKTPRIHKKLFDSLPEQGSLIISSKFHGLLRELRSILGGRVTLLASIQHRPTDPRAILEDAGADGLSVEVGFIDAELIESVHAFGGPVFAWTVNDAEQALRLASLGVDAITTDRPDLIVPALESGRVKENAGRKLYKRLTD